MKYALRLCSEHKKQEACVHIYSAMKLYEEAVDLALTVLITGFLIFHYCHLIIPYDHLVLVVFRAMI